MLGKNKQTADTGAATRRKFRLPKVVRNILVSVVALTMFCLAAGVAYTLFAGQKPQPSAIAQPAAPVSNQQIKAPKVSPNIPESAAVEAFTSPIAPGSNSSIDVKTLPGSTCTISVVYNNVASTDSGLGPKTADDFGVVSWSWTVGASTPLGQWPVKVTCSYQGRTAVVQADLEVARQ